MVVSEPGLVSGGGSGPVPQQGGFSWGWDHLALGFLASGVQTASSVWCVLLVAPARISLILHFSTGTETPQSRFLSVLGFSVQP